MKIRSVEVKTWSMPMSAANARSNWSHRRGATLSIDADGFRGEGEIAPLPGYSDESLDQALAPVSQLEGMAFHDISSLRTLIQAFPEALASLRFGIETAGLNLLASRTQRSVEALFGASPNTARPVSETLTELSADPIRAWFDAGIRTVKMKVGRVGLQAEECALAREIRASYPEIALRLDANRSYSSDQFARLWPTYRDLDIEFIEEPVHDPLESIPEDVPLALDETLREPEVARRVMASKPVRALILKPAVLGGVLACLDWVRPIFDSKIDLVGEQTRLGSASTGGRACDPAAGTLGFVASHLFDGEVAGRAVCTLARCLPEGPAQALGLVRAGGPSL